MIVQALVFLVDTLGTLLIVALLLRFWLQAARAPFNNPLSGLLASVTNWGVKPLRRVVPGLWGLDLATLLLAWLVAWALNIVLSLIEPRLVLEFAGRAGPGSADFSASVGLSAIAALVQLVRLFIYMMIGALIVQMLLSWVNPHSPLAPLLDLLLRPFLKPLQARIRPVSGFDLSPLVLLILCQLALILVVGGLARVVLMLI
ncbi:MAG: YggT family protein [Rhodocyclaceae bacterium]|jgi:YggT family protein|nr:YggT family protein [Rhodocyclaceae bacterium]MCE2981135.1 YggT family protein [Betaproteobacteria bacterium]MCA3075861.1 YggT family protein [Rhodocyclaceae bacterium]MCA3092015.1 YggT family protein [Rhodocyclaceae bacterium]MCA3095861.1 YggT family protein [Rhodocyclaceae bacterium]